MVSFGHQRLLSSLATALSISIYHKAHLRTNPNRGGNTRCVVLSSRTSHWLFFYARVARFNCCCQCRSLRSWSPPGLEKRGSVDGFVYKGRFRIRDVSFSGNYPPSAASVTSVSSAPAASRDATFTRKASACPVAAIPADGCITSPDQQSDMSDYSFYVVASEVSENDETGRLGTSGKSAQGRHRHELLSVGETSETSGGYDSELGRKLLVSPTTANDRGHFKTGGGGRRCKSSGGTSLACFCCVCAQRIFLPATDVFRP